MYGCKTSVSWYVGFNSRTTKQITQKDSCANHRAPPQAPFCFLRVSCGFPRPYPHNLLFSQPLVYVCMFPFFAKLYSLELLFWKTNVHVNVRKKSVQRSSCITSQKVRVLLSACTYNFPLYIIVYVYSANSTLALTKVHQSGKQNSLAHKSFTLLSLPII